MNKINNNPKQCENCCHTRVCSLKEKLSAYIEEYDMLNEKYGDFFQKNPTCPEYLSNGSINRYYHEINVPNYEKNREMSNTINQRADDMKIKAYKSLTKDSKGGDKYFKESKKEGKKPFDKSKTFYYEYPNDDNYNFIDENGFYKTRKLTEEDFIKVLEKILNK